jgi:hypothetical protein
MITAAKQPLTSLTKMNAADKIKHNLFGLYNTGLRYEVYFDLLSVPYRTARRAAFHFTVCRAGHVLHSKLSFISRRPVHDGRASS